MYEDRRVNKKVEPAWNGFYKISGLKSHRHVRKKSSHHLQRLKSDPRFSFLSIKDHLFDAVTFLGRKLTKSR